MWLGSPRWRGPADHSLSRITHLEGHQELLPEVPRPQLSRVFAWKPRPDSKLASSPFRGSYRLSMSPPATKFLC